MHLDKEEKLYNFLKKKFSHGVQNEIFTKPKEVITDEVLKLKKIANTVESEKILSIFRDFKDRIQ